MVNGVNNTTGISSYPQSFQDLIQKPQNSAPQGAQPTAAEGDKVNISKKSKGKKIAAGIGIAAAAVLALSTALHKLQPQIFTDMLAKEGFGGTIARGIDTPYFVFSCCDTIPLLYILHCNNRINNSAGHKPLGQSPYNSLLSGRSKHPFPPLDIF